MYTCATIFFGRGGRSGFARREAAVRRGIAFAEFFAVAFLIGAILASNSLQLYFNFTLFTV